MKKPKPNLYVKIINIVSFVIIAGSFLTAFIMWNNIPNQISTHFNSAGEIDSYGDKINIIVVLCVGLALWILVSLITLILKIPNIGVKATEYQILDSMLVTLKLIVGILFGMVAVFMAVSKPLPFWFTELFPLLFIGTIIFFIIFLFVKVRKKQ